MLGRENNYRLNVQTKNLIESVFRSRMNAEHAEMWKWEFAAQFLWIDSPN